MRGDEIVFCRGPLVPALLASAALPGIFPPVQWEGRHLVDGGVVDSVPLSHAVAGPTARIYVLNVSGGGRTIHRDPSSPLDVVMRSFSIARNQRFELETQHLRSESEITVLPRPRDERELFDFSGAARLIDESHRLAASVLDRHEPLDLTHHRRRLRWWHRRRAA
jgi:NTE family protein